MDAMFTIPDLSRRQSESVGGKPQQVRYHDKYRTCDALGKGGFGTVRACTCIDDGIEYAVKVVERGVNRRELDEVQILQLLKLTHPNFVQLAEVFETQRHLYIVMEMVKGGMLLRQIERSRTFSEATARRMAKQLLVAIEFMHGKGIVHRDLKPANLLLTESNIDATIKICDFGFARLVGDDPAITGRTGTLLFMAPEVITGNTAYGKQVDIWSFGVIFYILVCGFPPFTRSPGESLQASTQQRFRDVTNMKHTFDDDKFCPPTDRTRKISIVKGKVDLNRQHVVTQITNGVIKFPINTIWESISADCKDFASKLLIRDPDYRMTASDALSHPWMRVEMVPKENLKPCGRGQFRDFASLKSAAVLVVATLRLRFLTRTSQIDEFVEKTSHELGFLSRAYSHLIHFAICLISPLTTIEEVNSLIEFTKTTPVGKKSKRFITGFDNLTDETAQVVLEGLVGHGSIEVISLANNTAVTVTCERSLIRLVSVNTKLRRLDLHGTSLPDSVIERVQSTVKSNAESSSGRGGKVNILNAECPRDGKAKQTSSIGNHNREEVKLSHHHSLPSRSFHHGGRVRNPAKKPAVPTLAVLKREQREKSESHPSGRRIRSLVSLPLCSSQARVSK